MNKHFLNYSYASIISIVLQFVTTSYLVIKLSISDMANIGIFLAISTILIPIFFLRSSSFIASFISKNDFKKFFLLSNNIFIFSILITVFLIFINALLTFLDYLNREFFILILFSILLSYLQGFRQFVDEIMIQNKDSKLFSYQRIILIIFALLLTIFLIEFGWLGRLAALLIAELIFYFLKSKYYFDFIDYKFSFTINSESFINLSRYGMPLVISAIFGWMLFEADKFIAIRLFNETYLAIITVAISYGRFFSYFNQVIRATFIPDIRKSINMYGVSNSIKILPLYFLLFYLIMSFIVYFGSIYFDNFFQAKGYEDFYKYMLPTFISFSFFSSVMMINIILEMYSISMIRLQALFVACVFKIIAFVFLYFNGGAFLEYIYATLCSFFITFFILYTFILFKFKNEK